MNIFKQLRTLIMTIKHLSEIIVIKMFNVYDGTTKTCKNFMNADYIAWLPNRKHTIPIKMWYQIEAKVIDEVKEKYISHNNDRVVQIIYL